MPSLDLHRPRDFGDLLSTTLRLWLRHLGVFFALAILVVAPVCLLVDGVWGGTLADPDARPSTGAALASGLLDTLVVSALITAVHVVAVQGLARGERPTVGGSLRGAAPALLPVLAVIALYTVGTALMSLALVLPGIWFGVRHYFGAQAAIVDKQPPLDALQRSGELVDGSWWRTFGLLFVFGVLAALVAGVLGGVAGVVAAAVDSGPILVGATIVGTALAYSFSALAGTLLFFDLQARAGTDGRATARPGEPGCLRPAPSEQGPRSRSSRTSRRQWVQPYWRPWVRGGVWRRRPRPVASWASSAPPQAP